MTSRTWLIIIGCAIILLAAGVAQFLFPQTAVSPSLTIPESSPAENIIATSTSPVQITATSVSAEVKPASPKIVEGDIINSWDFKGAYTGDLQLVAKGEAEIKRLIGLSGTGAYTEMTRLVAIANQYELLGDGKKQYDYLCQAIEAAGGTSGLPWHNLGVLMERLGALKTARVAYDQAVLIQPQFKDIQEQ